MILTNIIVIDKTAGHATKILWFVWHGFNALYHSLGIADILIIVYWIKQMLCRT